MGYRNDLVLELDTVADGSGQYTGVWIVSASANQAFKLTVRQAK